MEDRDSWKASTVPDQKLHSMITCVVSRRVTWWKLFSFNDGKAEITSMPGTPPHPPPPTIYQKTLIIIIFVPIQLCLNFIQPWKWCTISPTIYNKMFKTLTQNGELFWRTTQSTPLTPTTSKDGLFLVSYRQLKHWHNIAYGIGEEKLCFGQGIKHGRCWLPWTKHFSQLYVILSLIVFLV